MSKLEIDSVWVRTRPGAYKEGTIEVLVRHEGIWKVVFPKGPGPVVNDPEQLVDWQLHYGGMAELAARRGCQCGFPDCTHGKVVPPPLPRADGLDRLQMSQLEASDEALRMNPSRPPGLPTRPLKR